MRVLIVVLALAALALAHRPKAHELTKNYSFEQYLRDFNKKYHGEAEYALRKDNFERMLAKVLAHNAAGNSLYKMGINHMSDWTEEESIAIRGGRIEPSYKPKHGARYAAKKAGVAQSLDYRARFPPILTAIKDQGQCGDCWAHSATEAIESSYAITTGELFVLSQQQVTSCTPAVGGCYSCNGSFPSLAFDYVAEAGITEEWIYPFESYNASFPACKKNPFLPTPIQTIVNITGYQMTGPNDQDDFLDALNNLGPLAILVDASSWSPYESGIFDGCNYANNISMDHAVNVIGYGHDDTLNQDYWIVRNSWAPSWGEQGFIRLLKTDTPMCGWNVGAAYSAGCYGVGPAEVWTCGMCGILFEGLFPNVDA